MQRLPNFLIVGAQKCGTSTLAAWLRAHPDVFFSERKELHFFSDEEVWQRGVDWYASCFEQAGDRPAIGEATPHYMDFPESIRRIAEVVPDAKLIVCLRDPVARAYSSYRHLFFRLASEPRPFRQAIEDELREDADLPGPGPTSYADLRYLGQGRYMERIEWLLERFPRESVHVMLLDDMEADPQGTFDTVCEFLGIATGFVPPEGWQVENAHRELRPVWLWRLMHRFRLFERLPNGIAKWIALNVFRRKPVPPDPIEPDLRAAMQRYFAPHNERLAAWLGRDLSSWEAR